MREKILELIKEEQMAIIEHKALVKAYENILSRLFAEDEEQVS